jgi:hypothetical protein
VEAVVLAVLPKVLQQEQVATVEEVLDQYPAQPLQEP